MALGRVKSFKHRAQNWLEGSGSPETGRRNSPSIARASEARPQSRTDSERRKRRQLPTVPPAGSPKRVPSPGDAPALAVAGTAAANGRIDASPLQRLEDLVERRQFNMCVEVVQQMSDDEFSSSYQQMPYAKLSRSFSPDSHCLAFLHTLLTRIANSSAAAPMNGSNTAASAASKGAEPTCMERLEFPVRVCHDLVVQLGLFLSTTEATPLSFASEVRSTRDLLFLINRNIPDIVPALNARQEDLSTALASLKRKPEFTIGGHNRELSIPKDTKPRRASFSAHQPRTEPSLSRKGTVTGRQTSVASKAVDETQRSVREAVNATIRELKGGLDKLDTPAMPAKPPHGKDGTKSQRESTSGSGGSAGISNGTGSSRKLLDLADLQSRFFATQSVLNALKKETVTSLLEQLTLRADADKQILSAVNRMKQDLPSGVFRSTAALEPLLAKHLHAINLVVDVLSIGDESTATARVQKPPASLSLDSGAQGNAAATSAAVTHGKTLVSSAESASYVARPPTGDEDVTPQSVTPRDLPKRASIGTAPSSPVYSVDSGVLIPPLGVTTPETAPPAEAPAEAPVEAPVVIATASLHRPNSAPARHAPVGMKSQTVSTATLRSEGAGALDELKAELAQANKELLQSCETVNALRRREKELTDRLAEQAQRQITLSGRFEAVSLPTSRTTQLVEQFADLYSQSRVEVLDALAEVDGDTLGMDPTDDDVEQWLAQFIIQIVQVCFSVAHESATQRVNGVEGVLTGLAPGTQDDVTTPGNSGRAGHAQESEDLRKRHLEVALRAFLREEDWTEGQMADAIKSVFQMMWQQYPDSRKLENFPELAQFTGESLRLAWKLSLQVPEIFPSTEAQFYLADMFHQFYTSDMTSSYIRYYLWPVLVQGSERIVLAKGVVVT